MILLSGNPQRCPATSSRCLQAHFFFIPLPWRWVWFPLPFGRAVWERAPFLWPFVVRLLVLGLWESSAASSLCLGGFLDSHTIKETLVQSPVSPHSRVALLLFKPRPRLPGCLGTAAIFMIPHHKAQQACVLRPSIFIQ